METSAVSEAAISAAFPFVSKFADVKGSRMHYIEQGSGDPILFLHGMATCSYIWRNIIPAIAPYGRCIAVDMIGMGKSDKPDIPYRIFDTIDYLTQFIKALGLRNITLVLHGWGSLAGFAYAMHHESNIKALAFVEAHIRPLTFDTLTMPAQELIALLRHPKYGHKAVVEDNYILTKLLPAIFLRKLSDEELTHYRAPYPTPKSRELLWQYIQDLPLPDGPLDVRKLLTACSNWLQKTQLPKLLLYGVPGFVTPMSSVQWADKHLKNLTLEDIGEAYHCPQENSPREFNAALIGWLQKLRH